MLTPLAVDPLEFEGDFETHATVRCDRTDVDLLEQWAASVELKLTVIVLGRGRVPVQPMIKFRFGSVLNLALSHIRW